MNGCGEYGFWDSLYISNKRTYLLLVIRMPFIKVPLLVSWQKFLELQSLSDLTAEFAKQPRLWQWQCVWLSEVTAWTIYLNGEVLARVFLQRIRKRPFGGGCFFVCGVCFVLTSQTYSFNLFVGDWGLKSKGRIRWSLCFLLALMLF